jgi:TonB family protein
MGLLLFLLSREETSIEQTAIIEGVGENIIKIITEAMNENPELGPRLEQDPQVFKDWIELTNSGEDYEEMVERTRTFEEEQQKAEDDLARAEQERDEAIAAQDEAETQARIAERALANQMGENGELAAILLKPIAGDTTLCAFLESDDDPVRSEIGRENHGPSTPIGIIHVEEEGITLLRGGYRSDQPLVDFNGDPFDREASEQVIGSWSIKEKLTWVEFESIITKLNSLGNDFASDIKQRCRHYFNYYHVGLDGDTVEKFRDLNYSGVKISEQEFLDLTFINANTDYRPITIVRPDYPRDAIDEFIEGFSFIAFTVSKTGTVLEESIVVIDSSPSDIFDEESRAALKTWRFQPQIVEGQAVDVPNVRYLFTFCEGRRNDCF